MTINTFLGKWKESGDARKPAEVTDMPEPVGRAMPQLWGVAWKEAQDGIKAEREALEAARRRDMTNEITRIETENAVQAEEITRLSERPAEATTALAETEKSVGGLTEENGAGSRSLNRLITARSPAFSIRVDKAKHLMRYHIKK